MHKESLMDLDLLEKYGCGDEHVCRVECRRSPEMQLLYESRCLQTRKTYATVADAIYCSYFDCQGTPNADGKLSVQVTVDLSTAWVFRKNAFPYDVEPDVQHWCLWHGSADADPRMAARLIGEFARARQLTRVVWFANEPRLRTVALLWHAHVFFIETRR